MRTAAPSATSTWTVASETLVATTRAGSGLLQISTTASFTMVVAMGLETHCTRRGRACVKYSTIPACRRRPHLWVCLLILRFRRNVQVVGRYSPIVRSACCVRILVFSLCWTACGGTARPHLVVPTTVTVLDDGQGIKSEFGYHSAAASGIAFRYTLHNKTEFRTSGVRGAPLSLELPTLTITAVFADEPTSDGGLRVRGIVNGIEIGPEKANPKFLELVAADKKHYTDSVWSWTLRADGTVAAASINNGGKSDDGRYRVTSISEPFLRSLVVFPTTPIGVGARWEVTNAIPVLNSTWESKATFSLLSMSDDTAVISILVNASAAKTTISVEPDKVMTMTSGSLSAQGEVTFVRKRIISSFKLQEVTELNVSTQVGRRTGAATLVMHREFLGTLVDGVNTTKSDND